MLSGFMGCSCVNVRFYDYCSFPFFVLVRHVFHQHLRASRLDAQMGVGGDFAELALTRRSCCAVVLKTRKMRKPIADLMISNTRRHATPRAKRCHVMFSGRFDKEHFMVLQNYIIQSPMRYIHTSPSKLRCRLVGV